MIICFVGGNEHYLHTDYFLRGRVAVAAWYLLVGMAGERESAEELTRGWREGEGKKARGEKE